MGRRIYPEPVDDDLVSSAESVLYWHGLLIEQVLDPIPGILTLRTGDAFATVDLRGERTVLFDLWKQGAQGREKVGDGQLTFGPAADPMPDGHALAERIADAIDADFGDCSKGYVQSGGRPGESIGWDLKIRKTPPKLAAVYVVDGIVQPADKDPRAQQA